METIKKFSQNDIDWLFTTIESSLPNLNDDAVHILVEDVLSACLNYMREKDVIDKRYSLRQKNLLKMLKKYGKAIEVLKPLVCDEAMGLLKDPDERSLITAIVSAGNRGEGLQKAYKASDNGFLSQIQTQLNLLESDTQSVAVLKNGKIRNIKARFIGCIGDAIHDATAEVPATGKSGAWYKIASVAVEIVDFGGDVSEHWLRNSLTEYGSYK